MAPPTATASCAPLLERPPPTDEDALALALPATPNAFNVGTLIMYVVLTPVLAYDAYTGGPDEWMWCLLMHFLLVAMVLIINFFSSLFIQEFDHLHALPT
jgi:hypothetical protein